MALADLITAHKDALRVRPGEYERYYLDMRQKDYPPVYSNATFVAKSFAEQTKAEATCKLALRFREGTGTTTVDDSASANTAAFNGAISWVAGSRGYGVLSDGAAGSYVRTNVNVDALLTTWSYGAYVKPATLQAGTRVAAGSGADSVFYVGKSTNDKPFGSWRDSGAVQRTLEGTTVFTAGAGHYVMLVHTGTLTYLYVDGLLEASDVVHDSASLGAGKWDVCRLYGGTAEFNGTVDDVRVYSVALMAAQARVVGGAHFPGSHIMTAGYSQYLIDMPTKFVVDIRAKATFAFDTVTNDILFGWYYDANNRFLIRYDAATDAIAAYWIQGGTISGLSSSALTAITLAAVNRITVVVDSTTGSTSGSALYLNGVSVDTSWSAAITARSVRCPVLTLRSVGAVGAGLTAGLWDIAAVRIFSGRVCTPTEVANDFRDVKDEEIYFDLNGTTVGRTRCNVTSYVASRSHSSAVEDPVTGGLVASTFGAQLHSEAGQWAADRFGTWDPTANIAGCYNGTAVQAYLKRSPRVIAETWYGTDFDPFFCGRVDENGFVRSTPNADTWSRADIGAVDQVAELAKRKTRRGRFYEAKKLASLTEADSLLHLHARLGLQRQVYNYLSNASFENATISNSWYATGGTLTRQAGGLIGSFCGQLANASGAYQEVVQNVIFTGTKRLNIGEPWTNSIWLKSAGAASSSIYLYELDAGGPNGFTAVAYNLAGGEGWVRVDVSRALSDLATDRLNLSIGVPNGVTLQMDCAMLTQSARAYDWFIPNTDDGSAGTYYADNADSATYDTCGFDIPAITIVDPWCVLRPGDLPWDHVKRIATATCSYVCGMSPAGVFTARAVLADGYRDQEYDEAVSAITSITAAPVQTVNRIIVRGTWKVIAAATREVWRASKSGIFALNSVGKLADAVLNGAQWPDPATYGIFAAQYVGSSPPGVQSGLSNTPAPAMATPLLYGTGVQARGVEMIGLKSPTLAQEVVNPAIRGYLTLTVTTLDTDTYSDSAIILLTNSTGVTARVVDVALRGRPVTATSGHAGIVHDAFADWDRIDREGDLPLELSSDYLVTVAQTSNVADFLRRFNAPATRSGYSVTAEGALVWMVPGILQRLTAATAKGENVDSILRLAAISSEIPESGEATTTLTYKEPLLGWVPGEYTSTGRVLGAPGVDHSGLKW